MKERNVPPFYQIPILLVAVLIGVVGTGIGLWEHMGEQVPWWVTGLPFAAAGAAATLVIADVIAHQHLSNGHVTAFAVAVAPLAVGMFMFTLAYGVFIAVALVLISVLAATT